jgi:UDP-N-acetylmuramoyl-L-alanyl-D-glutamate--2,6-diaminopimelate ligase
VSLATLATALPVAAVDPGADLSAAIAAVHYDSRLVTPGSLFACLRGGSTDGHDHAPEAVDRGAVALLCERPLGLGVPELVVEDARAALGPIAARFHGDPSQSLAVVGVTGTNGKTTTVHLLHAIFEAAGRRCGVIGTLTGTRTTPEAPDLQALLAAWRDEGADAVAMEVSSHALALHRVDGTRFRAVGFTNLSQDHLDFHGDLESYFLAKARLFTPHLADAAVVDADDVWGARLVASATIPTVELHPNAVEGLELGLDVTRFTWRGHRVELPLAGRFNVANALVAAHLALALDVEEAAVVEGLRAAEHVPGRFEVVDAGQPFAVVVDYAHTPDGLERALAAAREVTPGRVIVVFGCGGDRDRAKRPLMGAAAQAGADLVVITSDNPRGEDPEAIIGEVVAGVEADALARGRVRVVTERRAAIAEALAAARDDDVVIIAGKGHETVQVIGAAERPFDDRAVAAELVAAGLASGGAP